MSLAIEPGSLAPPFTLSNLEGTEVSLDTPSGGSILILYFFDASDEAAETLVSLGEAASKVPAALSLLSVSRENPERLTELLAGKKEFTSLVLNDDKGITFTYGLTRSLPAAVFIGPGGVVGATIAPALDARDILMFLADTLVSMDLSALARTVYLSVPKSSFDEAKIQLGMAYSSMMAGDADAARRTLESMTEVSSALSAEAHAGLAFLEFRQGDTGEALARCSRARNSGFAHYVGGMVRVRSDQCEPSSTLFGKAIKSEFAFRWQQALAYNMAARTAEEAEDHEAALGLYKKAFALAPLNHTIGANLLTYHWRRGNIAGAIGYADTVKPIAMGDLLMASLVNEFEADVEFRRNGGSYRLARSLEAISHQDGTTTDVHAGMPRLILVSDLTIIGCPLELNCLAPASAGLLKRSLESDETITTVPRSEVFAAAKRMEIPRAELRKPLRLAEIGRMFSADMLAFGELGSHKGEYLLNIRIADVASGEVVAVASERFDSIAELTPALQRSASVLIDKLGKL